MNRLLRRAAVLILMLTPFMLQADDRPYKDGTVWEVTFIRVHDDRLDDYVKNLNAGHYPIMDSFIKKGWVKSYKSIGFTRTRPKDWNMMLLVEFPNYAQFDRAYDEWNAVVEEVFKDQKTHDASNEERGEIREIWGTRLGREMLRK